MRPDEHPFSEDRRTIGLYAGLARSFRGSMLLRILVRALPYLILREPDQGDCVLRQYFAEVPPQLYAQLKARAFRDWINRHPQTADPLLNSLLDYDIALLEMAADAEPRVVGFPGDPRPVFEARANAQFPAMPAPPVWEIEILPDGEQAYASRSAEIRS